MTTTELFPEFNDLPSSALSIDICETNTHRIIVVGCQNGYLRFICSSFDGNL